MVLQNLFLFLPSAIASGRWYAADGGKGSADIARDDLALAAATVLAGGDDGKRVYTLSGRQALTTNHIVEQVNAIGKAIEVIQVPLEALVEGMAASGIPEPVARVYGSFDTNTAAGLVADVTDDFEQIYGPAAEAVRELAAGKQSRTRRPLRTQHDRASGTQRAPTDALVLLLEGADIVTNRQTVLDYLDVVFNQRNLAKAETYWASDMIQHNPTMPNGLDVLRSFIISSQLCLTYEAGVAMEDGELVMVHGRFTNWFGKAMLAVDIFRLRDGKVVEHWDVMQEEIPAEQAVNGNPVFPAK